MIGVYEVVMALLLAFPWFLVSTMVVGAMWAKVSSFVKDRSTCQPRARRAMRWAHVRQPIEIRGGKSA